MRFHTAAALYVLVFARFFAFSKENYIEMLIIIGAVISAEMINTAIEDLADKVCKEYHPLIKGAKDAAAGAVLVLASAAAVIGIILFCNIEGLNTMYNFYITHPINFALLIISIPLTAVYVFHGIPEKKKKK